MTDLPEILPHLRHNARRNALGGRDEPPCALAVCARTRWGEDRRRHDALPAPCRDADVVLGADLAYTTDARVIDALVETLDRVVPTDGVAVFARCGRAPPGGGGAAERGRKRAGSTRGSWGGGPRGGVRAGEGEDDAFRVVELRRRRGGGGGRGGEVRPGSTA